jgi:hypothetical protein
VRHEEIPFGEREFGIACYEPSVEMILPGLDCALGRVSTVNMGGNPLEVDGVFFERFFELVRAFLVEDVEIGGISIGL